VYPRARPLSERGLGPPAGGPAVTGAERALRDRGLRITRPRLAVLDVLAATAGHLSVEAVAGEVRRRYGTISVQTAYSVLDVLTRFRLARCIHPDGHPARYEARTDDDHHHAVCRTCGAISDIDKAANPATCLDPVTDGGYSVERVEVIFWGYCPTCHPTQ
jgi:Fur family transcriptional regulator, stress-responsive regulator